MRHSVVVCIALSALVRLAAQEPATTFDVVSVKLNLSGETRSGTESLPDRINATKTEPSGKKRLPPGV